MVDVLIRYGVNYANTPIPQVSDILDVSDTLSNDLQLPLTESTPLVLNVTGQQYTLLLSCVLNGATRHYPNEYQAIFELLIKAGKMALCDAIAECLTTNSTTQNGLQNALNQLNYPDNGYRTDVPNNYNDNPDLFDSSQGCSQDNLFGVATGLTDLLNTIIEDTLEIIVASANTAQQTGNVIEAIPLIGLLPFDDMLQIATDFLEDVQQNYAAAYTATIRDEIRCDIFCLLQQTCELDLVTIANYFAGQAQTTITQIDFEDVIEYFTNGTFSGVEYVWAMHYFVMTIYNYGGKIFGYDTQYVSRVISAMYNDPDSDHTTLCDCSIPQCALTMGDFSIDGNGSVEPDGSFKSVNVGGNQRLLYIKSTFAPMTIGTITIEMDKPTAFTNTSTVVRVSARRNSDNVNVTLQEWQAPSAPDTIEITVNDGIEYKEITYQSNPVTDSNYFITDICVT